MNTLIREGAWKFLMNPDGSRPELYDLADDPAESKNLADKNPRRVKAMSAQLEKWLQDAYSSSANSHSSVGALFPTVNVKFDPNKPSGRADARSESKPSDRKKK